ncbi:vacuolar fusion protein MON1 homolog isoform X2 [Physcomitrium patens]|uniref:Vacuolar fusion protein MON1 homolog n=4 Tax=Physcomitrium patens TaxID=3218 RepID=A0A7I4DDS0_PHYPA|nr:vacuolar fusion protein MON1 homolog isoform X2 [Physcomitrium patens]|eukprot:XP_024371446.1 vacuolar fusion protein MON1 homolog isoform X2 [Physcomitrella patens]
MCFWGMSSQVSSVTELLRHEMNNTTIQEMQSDIEELFDNEGERPCYLSDETHSETVNGAKNSDLEADNAAKLSDLDVSGNTQQDSTHDLSKGSSAPKRMVEEDGDALSEDAIHDGSVSLSSSRDGTSGYLAGSGSSTASVCSASGGDEKADRIPIQESIHLERRTWIPGKRHPEEDDTSPSWRKHKKHFFILSNAGKPIYSRYGDEHKLAGFSATLQAIMSFVENSGDTIRFVKAGDYQIVFLVKGPLYLVAISATEEPEQVIRWQLELLHAQLILILTKGVEKCFMKNSKFDMRPLLGGTDSVFSHLIHAFSWNPATFLRAYTCLPLPYVIRQAAAAALQDIPDSGALFSLLMSGSKVISLATPRKSSLSPNDIFLLSNYVSSSDSFRTTESFFPVCLPGYNPTAFLYAYVHYLNNDTCLFLLTADPEGFFRLQECRARIETLLRETDVLAEVANAVRRGGLRVEHLLEPRALPLLLDSNTSSILGSYGDHEVHGPGGVDMLGLVGTGGPAGLRHFVYKTNFLDQYVASEFSPPLHIPSAQKRLYRAYQKLHTSMHGTGAAGPHKMQYRRDDHHVFLSWRTSDFELHAAFDPLADKNSAVAVCNRLCQWLRDLESDIFFLGGTPLSWWC